MNIPIRVRLAAWYAFMLTLILFVLGGFIIFELRRDLRAGVDTELNICATVLVHALWDAENDPEEGDLGLLDTLEEDLLEAAQAALPQGTSAVQLLDAQGAVLVHYGQASESVAMVAPEVQRQAASGPQMLTTPLGADGQNYRVRVVTATYAGQPVVLVVGIGFFEIDRIIEELVLLLLTAGPAALLVTALAGSWLAGRALKPVRRMTTDAQAIGTDRLHERVAVPPAEDEVRRLAVTLNAMLDRIEQGATAQRQIVADASHELRSH